MTLLRTALLLLCILPPAAAAPGPGELALDPPGRMAYERAVTAFRAQRYPTAYGVFVRLADGGHVPSARLALVMHEHGPLLFERAWYASPDQQRRWNALVVKAARERAAALDSGASD